MKWPEITARLCQLPEEQVLHWFWLMERQDAPRFELLEQLSTVVIQRPDDWDRAAIRREHERNVSAELFKRYDTSACFSCRVSRRVYFHHVIEVQNGGSNTWRNLVPICFPCHQVLHPWLKVEPPSYSVHGWESVGDIGRRTLGEIKR